VVATPAAPRPTVPTSLAAALATVPDRRYVAIVTYPLAVVPTIPLQGVAIDGKAPRGRLRFAADGVADGCPVHALSAV